MFYLSNAANAILEAAGYKLTPQEFGYRFQSLVVEALKLQPDWGKLYDNRGAGQPDCYFGGYGFEIKCQQTNPMPIDDNGWAALRGYDSPRLIAMLSVSAPYPVWIADLSGLGPDAVKLNHDTVVDADLERHLKSALTALIEAVGIHGLVAESRQDVLNWIGTCRESIRMNGDSGLTEA